MNLSPFMFEMNKGEDGRNKGGGKPVIKRGKDGNDLKEGEESKGERGDEEKEKRESEVTKEVMSNEEKEKREVTKEELLQRRGETSVTGGQIGVGERRCEEGENAQTGAGVKWGTHPILKEGDMPPKSMGGDFLLRGSWDMHPSPKQGKVLVQGGGWDISPSPKQGEVLVQGGGLDISPSPKQGKVLIRGGGWDTRTVVLLLSALLAASLPQGNSH